MFVWFSAILFFGVGVAFIAKRKNAARIQGLMAGAAFPPGCAIAEGVVFLLLALAIATLGHDFLR